MNDANIATYDVFNPEMRLDCVANQTFFQVKEDKASYIPDFPSGKRHDDNREAHSAAEDHAKHLRSAERLLDKAVNLVGLMLTSLGDAGDSRAMQSKTGLQVIEKKLNKAHTRIDKHDTRHTNLFLAYCDLRDKTDGGDAN